MSKVFLRTEFNYDVFEVSQATSVRIPSGEMEDLADQSAMAECDINTIVERFGLGGTFPVEARQPMQGDFTNVMDLQSALDAVIASRNTFMEMPATTRSRFGNDPAAFYNFCVERNDDGSLRNELEMKRFGLVDMPMQPSARLEDVIVAVKELKPAPQG